MSNFFADALLGMMFLIAIWMLLVISCKIIELICLCLFNCFSPYLCPRRRRESWPVELCNILIILIICIDNTLFKWCGLWCGQISEKLRRCNTKLKLCKIRISKKMDKLRVKPVVYDDVHIIVINPYEQKHQIATVSNVINV